MSTSLTPVKTQTTWNDAAAAINRNFETLNRTLDAIESGYSVEEVAASAVRLTADISGAYPVGASVQEVLKRLVADVSNIRDGAICIDPNTTSLTTSYQGLALVWSE